MQTEKKLNSFSSFQFTWKYVKKYKANIFKFYFGWLFDSICSIIIPLLYGIMIDEIVYRQNIKSFISVSSVIIVVSIFSCILYFFIYAQHHYLLHMSSFEIRLDLFSHLVNLHASNLVDYNSGEIVSIIQHYPFECINFIIRGILQQINRLIVIGCIIFSVFRIDIRMGFIVLTSAIGNFLVTSILGKWTRKQANNYRMHYGTFIGWLYEVLSALRDIRIIHAVDHVMQIFKLRHRDLFKSKNKLSYIQTTSDSLINFINLLIQLIIFGYAGYLAFKNLLTIGSFTVIITFYSNLKDEITNLNRTHMDAQTKVSFIQKIYDFLHMKTEEGWLGKSKLVVKEGNISFQNVCFAYNKNQEILNDLSLNIKKGEKFALVGSSGCGKTTVAHLLIGLFSPQSGDIMIDGKSISCYTLKSIREQIGILEQTVLLFDGTIRHNLLLGKPKATDEELEKACEQAGILAYINELPNKLDTVIGNNGIELSGGQKQRIGIARLYLKNPKIIIFDEATSALDKKTEEEVLTAWKEVLSTRTAIIIAHKQSSVMMCDRVGIIENGHISVIGKPYELEQNNETFRSLFAIK